MPINNFRTELPTTIYYVQTVYQCRVGYYGPYQSMATAKRVATQKFNKGFKTHIVPKNLTTGSTLKYPPRD